MLVSYGLRCLNRRPPPLFLVQTLTGPTSIVIVVTVVPSRLLDHRSHSRDGCATFPVYEPEL